MTPLAELQQQDFSAGIMRDEAPQLIDPRGVYDLQNILLDHDGTAYRRGGSVNKANANFGSSLRFVWDGYLKPGRRTVIANTADFGVLAADDQTPINIGGPGMILPAPSATLGGILFLPGGYLYGGSRKTATYSVGTITTTNGSKTVTGTGTAWLATADAGMLLQLSGLRAYVVASVDSDTQLTLADPWEAGGGSGVSYTLYPLLQAAAPYEVGPAYYVTCANRLVTASGNVVKFSALGQPHTYESPVANCTHELPDGANVIGLATVNSILIVLTTEGIYSIQGLERAKFDTPGNLQHSIRPISRSVIALGPNTTTWEGGAVVPALDSIYLVDGVSAPTDLARFVKTLWRSHTSKGYRAGTPAMFNAHMILPIIDGGGAWIDTIVTRLDIPVYISRRPLILLWPMTRFAGAGGRMTALTVRASDTSAPILLGAGDAGRLVDCSNWFRPDISYKNDHDGTTHAIQIITRDFPVNMGVLRKVRAQYDLIDAASDNPTVQLDYSGGAQILNQSKWNAFNWNAGNWATPDDTDWNALSGSGPEDAGLDPFSWHVNKRMRFVRFRLKSSSPAARLTLRILTLFVRPSRKTR